MSGKRTKALDPFAKAEIERTVVWFQRVISWELWSLRVIAGRRWCTLLDAVSLVGRQAFGARWQFDMAEPSRFPLYPGGPVLPTHEWLSRSQHERSRATVAAAEQRATDAGEPASNPAAVEPANDPNPRLVFSVTSNGVHGFELDDAPQEPPQGDPYWQALGALVLIHEALVIDSLRLTLARFDGEGVEFKPLNAEAWQGPGGALLLAPLGWVVEDIESWSHGGWWLALIERDDLASFLRDHARVIDAAAMDAGAMEILGKTARAEDILRRLIADGEILKYAGFKGLGAHLATAVGGNPYSMDRYLRGRWRPLIPNAWLRAHEKPVRAGPRAKKRR